MVNKDGREAVFGLCSYCGKLGHREFDCPEFSNNAIKEKMDTIMEQAENCICPDCKQSLPKNLVHLCPKREIINCSYVGDDGVLVKEFLSGELKPTQPTREFESGAIRDNNTDKLDYDEATHPLVEMSFGEFMHGHTYLRDGTRRPADNWQKGIPRKEYMKSMKRHMMDAWALHHDIVVKDRTDGHLVTLEEALNAMKFNINGYILELLKGR